MDYNNIKVCKKQKKAHIPDDTLKKLKDKSIQVFSLIGVVLVGLTACSGEKEVKKDIEETTLPNEIETNMEEDKFNDVSNQIVVEEETTSINVPEEETVTSRNEETERPINKEEDNDKVYNELLNKLNNELEKKEFSKEADQALKDVLDGLYKNYPSWQEVYKDMPSVEEYIQKNLINIIKDINSLTIYDSDSDIVQKMLEEGQPLGKTDAQGNITMIFTKTRKTNNTERMMHELTHIYQMPILYNNEYFAGNEEIAFMFIEGFATFGQQFVNPIDTKIGATCSIANEAGTSIINYNKNNGIGYLVELNGIENLVDIVGYNTMYKVQRGEINLSELKNTITKNYSEEKANAIWNTMKKWYSSYCNDWQSDESYELGIKLQNLYLDCIKMDIENINSEQFKDFIKIYNYYKSKILVQITNSNEEDITHLVFNIAEIDNMINQKVNELTTPYIVSSEVTNRNNDDNDLIK